MAHSQRIVVKLGTSTLTGGEKSISQPRMIDLARQIGRMRERGCEVAVVSSGAIAAGREVLGYPDLPKFIPKKQMLAAIGQPRLMALYEQFFGIYGTRVAQILLTRDDLSDRRRYLNARNTLDALLMQKVIPVINENDTVATEEIRFGDNDSLSAQVASLVEADALFLLTDQDGLFTGDPRSDAQARLIEEVPPEEIPDELWAAAGGSRSGLGTGGMVTKLYAADIARRSGTTVYIARGDQPDILERILAGERLGTCFPALENKLEGRKRYLLANNRAEGMLTVDAGAARALARGGSLLPVGVTTLSGDFERGDTVRVNNPSGKMIGLGLSNYSSRDLAAVFGKQSTEIETILGFTFGDEVVHRNNLILL
jgi:glutamate 5-kinase